LFNGSSVVDTDEFATLLLTTFSLVIPVGCVVVSVEVAAVDGSCGADVELVVGVVGVVTLAVGIAVVDALLNSL